MIRGNTILGYRVMATIDNKFALAVIPKAPQPWVIWRIDRNGNFYNGEYMFDKKSALRRFRQLGFQGVI